MIGMYAHHAGSGHLHRVRAIQHHLDADSVVFSSAEGADITLPLDLDPDSTPEDHTAGGTLHWAPVGVDGLSTRLAIIAQWIAQHRPSAFYVDCSVEVATFVRLMGVPVITIAMPGARFDEPHQLGYTQASAIIAAWPDWVSIPPHLAAHADRLHMVGGISRFESVPDDIADPVAPREGVVILRGVGGDNFDSHDWPEATILGGDVLVDDPTLHLRSASVVIAAAGQNSVADIALTQAPAIIFPQERPFGEQYATAQILEEAGLAVVRHNVPEPGQWEELIKLAARRAKNWHRWQTTGAAQRAAAVIDRVAARNRG